MHKHALQTHETCACLGRQTNLHAELHEFVSRAKRIYTSSCNSFFQVLNALHYMLQQTHVHVETNVF